MADPPHPSRGFNIRGLGHVYTTYVWLSGAWVPGCPHEPRNTGSFHVLTSAAHCAPTFVVVRLWARVLVESKLLQFLSPWYPCPPVHFRADAFIRDALFGKLPRATSGYDGSCRRLHDAFNLRSFRGSWPTRSFYVRLALPMVYHCCRVVLVRQPSQTQGKGGSTLPELGAFILPTLSRLALIGMPNIVSAILEIAPLFTSAVLL